MKQLDLYLARTVGLTMSLAVFGIVGMLAIFTFIEQMEDVTNNYKLVNVGQFVLYSLPRMFHGAIPFSALIGCIAGLGLLANSSELIVMRSAGVSTWSISWGAIKPALVLVGLGLFVGEYILPDFERIARNDRTRAMSDENEITPEFGFWYREGSIYMHFDEVGQSGLLEGVSHFYFREGDDRELVKTMFAERAVFHDMDSEDDYWLLEKVIVTEINGDNSVSEKVTSLQWHTNLTPEILSTEILVQPDRMSIRELSNKIDYLRSEGLNSSKFELGFWSKVLQPFATVGLVFVAISFVFGPLREATTGMRVVTGLIIGIIFKFVQDLLSPASLVFGFPPAVASLIPIVICFVVGYMLMRRAS
jgi:lipopolysaccharide export system permease protein|tara:strand:+ start:711 stop:1796 length:1086 start_codon:yes stop_codon:yes gene_type:complete